MIKARRGSPTGPSGLRPVVPFCLGFLSGVLFLGMLPGSMLSLGAKKASTITAARATSPEQYLQPLLAAVPSYAPRKKVLAVVGVQTGFTTDPHPRYSYENRRAALRATWFPADQEAVDRLEEEQGLVVRFVVGHSQDSKKEAALSKEEAAYGGFWRLPLLEGYRSLTTKSLMFLREAALLYDAKYIIKVDDDVYFRLDRLPHAIKQWREMDAGYVGCFKSDGVFKEPDAKWYEPQHALFGGSNKYFAHAWGPAYVVSGAVAADLAAMRPGSLRFFNNEDVTVGAWMLALNVTHYDDRRLCSVSCSESSLAVYEPKRCPGLCDPVRQLAELHRTVACHMPAVPSSGSLPLVDPLFDFGKHPNPHHGLLWHVQQWLGV